MAKLTKRDHIEAVVVLSLIVVSCLFATIFNAYAEVALGSVVVGTVMYLLILAKDVISGFVNMYRENRSDALMFVGIGSLLIAFVGALFIYETFARIVATAFIVLLVCAIIAGKLKNE